MSLGELLEELTTTLKATSDPFRIRVAEILEELREKLPHLSDEELQLDGEIISLLAKVVREQEIWVKREASIAAVGKLLALLKVKALSERELAGELLESWHPIVDLQQVTFTELRAALSYLEGREEFKLGGAEAVIPEPVTLELSVDMEEVILEVEEELSSLLAEKERIPYRQVVGGRGKDEALLRAYALSYLATSGRITIVYDPFEEEHYIQRAQEGEAHSQVVELRRYLDAS